MTNKLYKQDVATVAVHWTSGYIHNTPGGHDILILPEPMDTDPINPNRFKKHFWCFCSPLAEKKFWKHSNKEMDHYDTLLKELLISVFRVPDAHSRGVLFEKVAHTLITNVGVVVEQFRCYPYNEKD